MTRSVHRCFMVVLLIAVPSMARAADPLRLFAAGSLTGAMTALLAESGLPAAAIAPPGFGPSGVLRERIEGGAPVDVFASADMAQPRRLAAERGVPVVTFTRNSLCALASTELGATPANPLDRMLDPHVKLATSPPGADPGGDYAWAVFARAEALHPGAKAALEAKALKLVGGPDSKPLVPGKGPVEGVFLSHAADIMLGYCSGSASITREVPGVVSVPLPPELTVGPAYGMVVLTDHPLAQRLRCSSCLRKARRSWPALAFSPSALPNDLAYRLRRLMVRENEIRTNERAFEGPLPADATVAFVGRIRIP